MKKKPIFNAETNNVFKCDQYEGEDIHEKMERIMTTDGIIPDDPNASRSYTLRKDGVLPQFDIRTDKWDMALEELDAANKSKIAASEKYTKDTEM